MLSALKPFDRALLFDMDGVLVDTEPLLLAAVVETLTACGAPAHGDKADAWFGASEREFYAGMAARHGLTFTDRMEEAVRARFLALVQAAPARAVYPESVPVLEAFCAESDLGLAVCSGAGRWKVNINLESLGEAGRVFDVVVSGDDVSRSKPAPDIFLEGARRLGVPPECCLVVEDSVAGVRAASAAGMRAIAVTHTYPAEAFEALSPRPVRIVPHLNPAVILAELMAIDA